MYDTNYEEVISEQEREIRSLQGKLDDLYDTTKKEIQRLHQICRNYEDEIRGLTETTEDKHPSMCYFKAADTGCLCVIEWGQPGYSETCYPAAEGLAEELNYRAGISKEEADAMISCSIARPKDWSKHYKECLEGTRRA